MTINLEQRIQLIEKAVVDQDMESFFQWIHSTLLDLYQHKRFDLYIRFSIERAYFYFQSHNLNLTLHTLEDISPFIESKACSPQKLRYYRLMAAVQREKKAYTEMLVFLKHAERLAEQSDALDQLVEIYHQLCVYYLKVDQLEECIAYCRKCLVIYEQSDATLNRGIILLDYAKALIQGHYMEEAQQILKEARTEIWKLPPNKLWVQLHILEATFLKINENHFSAYELLQRTIRTFSYCPHWIVDAYELLVLISKRIQPPDVYAKDLKNYSIVLKQSQIVEKKNQIVNTSFYFDDKPFKETSWNDAMTSIYNRKYIDYHFEQWQKDRSSYVVILFDIDHFKQMNDTYGHLFGDRVIQQVATRIDTLFIDNAMFARLGGDEFIGFIPFESFEQTSIFLKQMHTQIQAISLKYKQQPISISISIGAKVITEHTTLQRAIQLADIELYKAKNNGRSQFILS